MKRKSYNIFIILFVTLIMFSFIFFLVIKNNSKKERERSLLNKITYKNSNSDIENLTPLEKDIWDKFMAIPTNEYHYRYAEIVENNRVLLNLSSERNIGIYILKQLLDSGELSPKSRLFILNKLRVLDSSSDNIVNTIKLTMDYLNLAEELNSEYDIIRAKIALSWIFTNLEGYKAAINILTDIDIKNKNFPEISKVESYLYFYLAENYFYLKEYDTALKYLEISPNIQNEPIDYQKNISLLKNLLATRIYIDLDNQNLAKQSLDNAKILFDNLEKFYFIDLKNFYILTAESYSLKYDFQNFSPTVLEEFIKTLKNHGDILFLKGAFKLLFNYYYDINDFDNYRKLGSNYDSYLKKITGANNKVFSLYLIESLENERYITENENLCRNITLLFISILIILGISYKRIQYLDKKAKIDTLTDIGNRLAFKKKMSYLKDDSYSMLLFDIDNFKKINDTYGHEFGDEVLSKIGKILKTIENKEITIYRIGGEEFAIIFTHFNDTFAIENCEYIKRSIENICWKHPITVTISGGFSKATKNTYAECDKRLYKAKSSGKNIIIYQHINEGDVK